MCVQDKMGYHGLRTCFCQKRWSKIWILFLSVSLCVLFFVMCVIRHTVSDVANFAKLWKKDTHKEIRNGSLDLFHVRSLVLH